jgi:hypothetical protein
MIALDALDGDAPTVYAVLTTREATLFVEDYYEARRQVMRALARRWPSVRYLCVLEFTTGYAASSGGRRRPHWNLLLKGIPAEDAKAAKAVIRRVWCSQLGRQARPQAQYVAKLADAGGVMRYLALHFLKESQSPPEGWKRKGQRVTFTKSRRDRHGNVLKPGYFSDDVWRVRQRAQDALRLKRELWKAGREGLDGAEALHVAELRALRSSQRQWECVVLSVDPDTGEVTRARPLNGGGVTRVMRSDIPHARRRCSADDAARAVNELTALRVASASSASDGAASPSPRAPSRRHSAQAQARLPGLRASSSEG